MWTVSIGGASAHVPGSDIVLVDPKLKKSANSADKLEFRITADHPLYDTVINGVFAARYEVERDGVIVSRGRILSRDVSPLDASCKVVCEGELAYLADAVMPEYDFSGAPSVLIGNFLDAYNSQCDEASTIRRGRVTVVDANDYIVRGNESPSNLLSELLEKTVKSSMGGYLQIRNEAGIRYLDWLATLEYAGAQDIAKGSNLLDISDKLDGADIITAILPKGNKDGAVYVELPDGEDGQIEGDVWRRGKCLYSKTLLDVYGWHATVVKWDDVTIPDNLLAKATAYVKALTAVSDYTIGAVDLRDAGYDVAHLDIGQRVRVICDGIEGDALVTGCEWDMDNPTASRYTFGKEPSASSAITAASSSGESGAGWSTAEATFIRHSIHEYDETFSYMTDLLAVDKGEVDDSNVYDDAGLAFVRVVQGKRKTEEHVPIGGDVIAHGEAIDLYANKSFWLSMAPFVLQGTGEHFEQFGTPASMKLSYGADHPTHTASMDAGGVHFEGFADYNGVELNTSMGAATCYMPLQQTCTTSDVQLGCSELLYIYDPCDAIGTYGNNITVKAGYIVEVSAFGTFQGTSTHQNAALTIYKGSSSGLSLQSKYAQAFASFWSTTARFSYVGITPIIMACDQFTYISLAARSTTAGAICQSGAGSSETSTLPSTALTVKVIGKL